MPPPGYATRPRSMGHGWACEACLLRRPPGPREVRDDAVGDAVPLSRESNNAGAVPAVWGYPKVVVLAVDVFCRRARHAVQVELFAVPDAGRRAWSRVRFTATARRRTRCCASSTTRADACRVGVERFRSRQHGRQRRVRSPAGVRGAISQPVARGARAGDPRRTSSAARHARGPGSPRRRAQSVDGPCRARRANLTVGHLARIADALDVSPSKLLSSAEEKLWGPGRSSGSGP